MTKQCKIIENRVDKANVRYSESLAVNKDLREKIDNLRRERVIFEQVFNKLEKDLGTKRRQMAALVEEVNKSYTEKDGINQKTMLGVRKATEK